MKYNNLSDQQRRKIVLRVENGEKQKDLAAEYGVHKSSISRLMRQVREKRKEQAAVLDLPTFQDMTHLTTEQLDNRFSEAHRQLFEHREELFKLKREASRLRAEIHEISTNQPLSKREEAWLAQLHSRYLSCRDTEQIIVESLSLYREITSIVFALHARGESFYVDSTSAAYYAFVVATRGKRERT